MRCTIFVFDAAGFHEQDLLLQERIETPEQSHNPPPEPNKLRDGLYTIFGPGGNVGVRVTSEGVILVDDKFPQNFEEIQRLVSRVSDLPVRYVINTHHHGDHAGGNVDLERLPWSA